MARYARTIKSGKWKNQSIQSTIEIVDLKKKLKFIAWLLRYMRDRCSLKWMERIVAATRILCCMYTLHTHVHTNITQYRTVSVAHSSVRILCAKITTTTTAVAEHSVADLPIVSQSQVPRICCFFFSFVLCFNWTCIFGIAWNNLFARCPYVD